MDAPRDLGIANILHRGTLAVLAGARTFERGQACFASGSRRAGGGRAR
jgi:hypothetical protein